MRHLLGFVALAMALPCAAQPVPATASPSAPSTASPSPPPTALLDCPMLGVNQPFREKLADAMLKDDPANDVLFEELLTVTNECAVRFGLADDKAEPYFTYGLARLAREVMAARLGALGISAARVDQTFDLGEGRANPVLNGAFNQAQVAALVAALAASGIDFATLPTASGEAIGAYAATSSLMWQARSKL